jgi:hypothetical protein
LLHRSFSASWSVSSFNDTAATTTTIAIATTISVPPDPTTTGINLSTWGSAHALLDAGVVESRALGLHLRDAVACQFDREFDLVRVVFKPLAPLLDARLKRLDRHRREREPVPVPGCGGVLVARPASNRRHKHRHAHSDQAHPRQ